MTTGAWCRYDNDSATYAATYGRLYNWYAVNDSRGLAPNGWHVPTDAEWNKMTKFLDESADTTQCCYNNIANALKSSTGWPFLYNGTNSSGFTAMPGGYRFCYPFNDAFFFGNGDHSHYWTASEISSNEAWFRFIVTYSGALKKEAVSKKCGFAVRLIKE